MRAVAYWLSLTLIFIIPWEALITLEGSRTLARIIGLLVLAFWVGGLVTKDKVRKLHPFHLAACLFVVWSAVSILWSVDADRTAIRISTYFQVLGLTVILWDLYTTPAALRAGLQAYVLGGYVAVSNTVYNYLTSTSSTYHRYTTTGSDPNYNGLIIALAIPVAWHLAVSGGDSKKDYVLRVLNYAYLPAATFAILLTASRSSVVFLLPAFLFVVASLSQLKLFARVSIFVVIIYALFTVQALAPQSSFQRLSTTEDSIAEASFGGRGDLWRGGIEIFLEHLLLGTGSGTFDTAARQVFYTDRDPHNTFVSVLVEVGIIGFVLFIFMLGMAVRAVMHQPRWVSRMWLTVFLIGALGCFINTMENRKPFWLLLSLMVVGAGISVQRDESRLCLQSPAKSIGLPKGELVNT